MFTPSSFAQALLSDKLCGLPHYRFDSVSSTQLVAREIAHAGEGHEFCVSAARQEAGRGRLGRRWESPEGSLSLSIILAGNDNLMNVLSTLTSLAVFDMVRDTANMYEQDFSLMLKWPNDVLIDGAKCAGILIEYIEVPRPMFIVGIGMNLRATPEGLPYPVTNLTEKGVDIPPLELTQRLVEHVITLRDQALQGSVRQIYRMWQERAHPVGTILRARTSTETLQGEYQGLHEDGALRLLLTSGEERLIYSADCVIRREPS